MKKTHNTSWKIESPPADSCEKFTETKHSHIRIMPLHELFMSWLWIHGTSWTLCTAYSNCSQHLL